MQKSKIELAHKVCSASASNVPGKANSKLTLDDFKKQNIYISMLELSQNEGKNNEVDLISE
jgi:hypothetical protein